MIHALPEPIESQTHAQITKWTDHLGSGITLRYRFGTVDAEGEFVPSRIAAPQERMLRKPQADVVRGRAEEKGAPITHGVQEYRLADMLDVMDAEGWW